MATVISTFSEVLLADTRVRPGTVLLPPISQIPYRMLSFKDVYGSFSNSTLTLSTQSGNTFEDSTTSIVLSNAYSFFNLYAASTKWVLMNGSQSIVQSISTLNVNSLVIGNGLGWIQMGPIQTVAVSTTQVNVQNLYANCNYFGTVSSQTALQFYGLQGNYNNTVIAEQSTGRGTQELLLFKGSSPADQVRIQTTGSIVFEPGVPSRLWPSYAQVSTPTMILNSSQYVGIWTSSPQVQLDVGGTGRFFTVSTLALNVSSIAGVPLVQTSNLVSSVIGLGTAGYVSSSQLTSTTAGIYNTIGSYTTTTNLVSTVVGLGSIGYVSSSQLGSTTQGLLTYISTFVDPTELASTVANLISTTFLASQLTSTVIGLGTAGYVSSSQLGSTTQGLLTSRQTQLTSTVIGLGTAGYISSSQLTSTTTGTFSYVSSFFSTNIRSIPFFYSGETVYMNYSIPGQVSPYKQLGTSNILGPSYSNVLSVPLNSSNNFVVGFQSDFTLPSFIATGLWTVALFCEAADSTVSIYSSLYLRDVAGTETLVATSSDSPFIVPQTKVELDMIIDVPYTNIPPGNTIIIKIFANNTKNQVVNFTSYYEDGNYSHVHTTFGVIIAQTIICSTIAGLGTLGYVSSSQLGSTTQGLLTSRQTQLTSTVIGLGTAGYISSSQLTSTTAGIYGSVLNIGNLASTVTGLGTAGYISSSQLGSTTQGLLTYISTFIDPVELASTVANLISTTFLASQLTSTVVGLGTAGYISSSQLTSTTTGIYNTFATVNNLGSTVVGLGTAGYISSSQLGSTTQGLLTYISSFIDPVELASTVANLVSTTFLASQFASTVGGLGTAGYISSSQLGSTTQGLLTSRQLQIVSTVAGLGTAGYISSQQLISTVAGLSTNIAQWAFYPALSNILLNPEIPRIVNPYDDTSMILQTGFLNIQDSYGTPGNITTGSLTFSVSSSAETYALAADKILTGSVSSFAVARGDGNDLYSGSMYVSSLYLGGIKAIVKGQLTTDGTATDLFWNGSKLNDQTAGGFIVTGNLTSTVAGLGTIGYVSSSQLISTTHGLTKELQNWAYYPAASSIVFANNDSNTVNQIISPGNTFFQLVNDIGIFAVDTSFVTKPFFGSYFSLVPSVDPNNLVTIPYQYDITAGSNFTGVVSSPTITTGGGSAIGPLYLSSLYFGTTSGTQYSRLEPSQDFTQLYYNDTQLAFVTNFVSTPYLASQLTSTVAGLGSIGYVSSSQLGSTTQGLLTSQQTQLTSTVIGLGTAGYVSSSQLGSTTQGLLTYISSFIDPVELASTVANLVSTTFLASQFASTVGGLGTAGYISSSQLGSTTQGLLTTQQTQLTSTVIGLGTAGYASTTFVGNALSSMSTSYGLNFTTGTLTASNITAPIGYVSSLNVDQLIFGDGNGWADFGALRAVVVSTIQINTGYVYAGSLVIAPQLSTQNMFTSTVTFGDINDGSKQVLAVSSGILTLNGQGITGGGGGGGGGITTENLLSTVAGLGSIGYISSTQLTSTTAGLQTSFIGQQGIFSSLYINITPDAAPPWTSKAPTLGTDPEPEPLALDVYGSVRVIKNLYVGSTTTTIGTAGITTSLIFASTLAASTVSVLNQISVPNLLASTITLIDITTRLPQLLVVSSGSLIINSQSILGSNVMTSTNLISTVAGLGSIGYISSSQLTSTTAGIYTALGTFVDVPELTSTVVGLGSIGYISSSQLTSTTAGIYTALGTFVDVPELTSTVAGLGSIGYISSSQLTSTTAGIYTAFIDVPELTSTVAGLGSIGYISSSQLTSTTAGIYTAFIDVPELTSTVAGLGTARYISSSQLTSTTAGIYIAIAAGGGGGAVANLVSTVNTVGGIAFNNLSTLIISTGSISANVLYVSAATVRNQFFVDIGTGAQGSALFQSSTYLYFGGNIVAPARVAPIQTIVF